MKKKETKVLFAIPQYKPIYGGQKNPPPYPHVGIAYLAAVLKKENIPVEIYDEGVERDSRRLNDLINVFKPTIIGVTGFSFAYKFLYDLIKKIKSYSEIPVIVGGPHVAIMGKEIIKETGADFAFIGEGEEIFPVFLKELVKKQPDFGRIPGLIWKKGEKIVGNPPPIFIKDLDELPFPDYEAFSLEKYPCYRKKVLPLLTSRGCPYGCNYCSVRLSMGRGFRARTPKNILEEINHWVRKGYSNFEINDDCFSFDIDRAEKICDLISKEKLKIRFQLYNGIRVDKVSPSLLHKLKKAGCSFIAYGCETGNREVLKNIGKNITLEQVKQAVDWTNKAGIENAVNFIVGHKEETYPQALDSLRFAEKLPTNFVGFFGLIPYPGTEAYTWAVKNAHFLVPKKTFLETISYQGNTPIIETKEFTKEQREEVMKKGLALTEKKILQSLQLKQGKVIGILVFLFTRSKIITGVAKKFIYKNKFGMKVFQLLVVNSKRESG